MIIDNGGRFNSVRTKDDLKKLLAEDWKKLSGPEKEAILQILKDFEDTGRSPIYEAASKIIYERPVVPIAEFIRDPYYFGNFTSTIYPSIIDDMIEIFSGNYSEVILGGSLGSGKSTQGVLIFIRMLYEISCLKNPNEAYGIMSGDRIAFMYIAITQDVARNIIGSKVRSYLKQIPYFNDKFKALKMLEDEIIFPKNIWVAPGASSEKHTIGANTYGALMEETNFFTPTTGKGGEKVDHAEEIYNSIKRRMESRFKNYGRLPGKLVIVSSKTGKNAFTERRIKESANDPNVFVRERAFYEAAPKERFSKETFRVAVGNETTMSRILESGEENPEGQIILEVPVDFKESFEKDIDRSIRDISGVSTYSVTPFITRRNKIAECIDKTREHPFPYFTWSHDHPFKMDWSKVCTRDPRDPDGLKFIPKVNPMAPRHVHVDFSKSDDPTGLTIAHVAGMVKVSRTGHEDEYLPYIYVDLVLQIFPQTNGEVVQSEIRKLIYEFSKHGFYIKHVSADQYQSVSFLQTMSEFGCKTSVVSMDRPNGNYDTLKQVIYEGRINYYRYQPLIKELMELQKDWKTGKIDHPPKAEGGSKDISDSLCGCVATLSESSSLHMPNVKTKESVAELLDEENWVMEDGSVMLKEHGVIGERRKENQRDSSVEDVLNNRYSKVKYDLPFEIG